MVRKIKKLLSMILTLALLISGTMILPPQALAESVALTSGNTISGIISLPAGVAAPAGGLEGKVYLSAENQDGSYSSGFTIPFGSSSTPYSVTVPGDDPDAEYRVRYYLHNTYPGYVGNGYYSTKGTTNYSKATFVNVSSGDRAGIDLKIFTGKTISGIITLTDSMPTPTERLDGNVNVSASNGGNYYYAEFSIGAGSRSASYTATVSSEDSIKDYRVSYDLYNTYPGYVGSGYYSIDGTTTNYSLATLVHVSSQDVTGKDLTIFTGNTISGTIALTDNMSAPLGGLEGSINLSSPNGDNYYYSHFEILAGVKSASYTVTVSSEDPIKEYRVGYNLNYEFPGYIGRGYYSLGGMASHSDATYIKINGENEAGVDLTIYTGDIISGNISLPIGVNAPEGGLEGQIRASSQSDNDDFYSSFYIPSGRNSISYSTTVPKDTLDEHFQVSYYLYDDYLGYLGEGYYSEEGTTTDDSLATPVDASSNIENIDLIIFQGNIISGTISLPGGVGAPTGGLSGSISVSSQTGNDYYYANFTFPSGATSADYSITVPKKATATEYELSYYLSSDNGHSGYLREGYYSETGTVTDYDAATLISVSGEDIDNINFELLTGNTISGIISLPGGVGAPTGGLTGNITVSSQDGNYDYHYANFTFPSGAKSADYSITVPEKTTATDYKLSYNLSSSYDHSGYLSQGYYAEGGTVTNSNSSTLINVGGDDVTNIDFELLAGNAISGIISLPGDKLAPAGGVRGNVRVYPENGDSYYVNFKIAAGTRTAIYSVTVPKNSAVTGYDVSYSLYNEDNSWGYLRNGYYFLEGTLGGTTENNSSATPVEVGANDVPGINLTIIKGSIISGMISLPGDKKAPAGGLKGNISFSPQSNGNGYSTQFEIAPGMSSAPYAATVSSNPSVTGYRVSYYLNSSSSDGYLSSGYYYQGGTTTNYSAATFVDVRAGDVSSINLRLLPTDITLPSSISLDKATAALTAGQTEQLTVSVLPDETSDKSVRWTIQSESTYNVATVSTTGLITAINVGNAVIKVTSNADSSKYAVCNITVTPAAAGDNTALTTAITTATSLLTSKSVGSAVNNVSQTAHDNFSSAILSANNVKNDSLATQAQLDNALADLALATIDFNEAVIKAGPGANFSATPVVQFGVNPNGDGSAGMFIGLENIKDSENNPVENSKIGGYEIEVNFDPNQVSIPDVFEANSSDLFAENIIIDNDTGIVLVSSASAQGIANSNQLFFIPVALKGSALDETYISVKYIEVRDTSVTLQNIQVPNLEDLKFQRGKIVNGTMGKPTIADAVAGLQYLSKLRNLGLGVNEVNLVNMGSIIESEVNSNIAKPDVKDVIALLQYTVNLRDDHFHPTNLAPGKLDFGYRNMFGTLSGRRLEIFDNDLVNGDLVQVLKGSSNTDLIAPITVQKTTTGDPLVIDNLNFGSELYLIVRITRGGLVGERLIYDNLQVSMAGIGAANTTDVTISGLQAEDEVSLFTENKTPIGSPQSVGADGSKVTFSGVSVDNSGVRVQIHRPNPACDTPSMFYFWDDLITYGCKTEPSSSGRMTLTVQYLQNGDRVNLYDSEGVAITGSQGLSADSNGKVIFSDLNLASYYVEVLRGDFQSRRQQVYPPLERIDYGLSIRNGTLSGKQLRLYDLQVNDIVEVLNGSNNLPLIQPVTITAALGNTLILDNIDFANQLFLRLHVTRAGIVDKREIFDNLLISMGAIGTDYSTSIMVKGLESGDKVSLFNGSGSQIGSAQTLVAGSDSTIFNSVSMTNEDGVRVQINRPSPASLTPKMFHSWGDLIEFDLMTELTATNLERLIVRDLKSGDLVNLYDSEDAAVLGRQNLPADALGKVIIDNLDLRSYQVEVVRGNFHSRWRKAYEPMPSTVVTAIPAITGIVRVGDTSIKGTATPGASVVLSIRGIPQEPVTADNGLWTVNVSILAVGDSISVTAQSAGETVSPAYVTSVSASEPIDIPVASITVNSAEDAASVQKGSTLAMSATVLPANATARAIVWSVKPLAGGTATIDSVTGLLTGTREGTVLVTAKNIESDITGTKVIIVEAVPVAQDLIVTSTAFENEGVIPNVNVLSGSDNGYSVLEATNQSIPLNWGSAAPVGHSFFIIMTDIDAGNWNHWVVKDISHSTTSLNAGASTTCDLPGTMPLGSTELLTSWGLFDRFTHGYYGPKPPIATGPHRYEIEVFELDTPTIDTTNEGDGYTYLQLRDMIDDHIVRSGKIMGTYTA